MTRNNREAAHDELLDQDARAAAILQSSLDAILSVDADSRIQEFNAAAERTFGHDRSAVLGRDLTELIIPARLRTALRRALARDLAGDGRGGILNARIETTAVRADGSEFPVELAVVRVAASGAPTFAAYLRDISERHGARAELERERDTARHAASHDPLTGLPNRRGLQDAFDGAGDRRPAVVTIALGGLSAVAEAFGAATCDELVRRAAFALRRVAPAERCLARVEDRVFALLTDPTDVAATADHCAAALAAPIELDGIKIHPQYTIGTAAGGDELSELLRQSAVARSGAHADPARRRRPVRYETRLDTTRARLRLISDLEHAIAADELELHYQPLFRPDTRALRGLEALVRWRRPDGQLTAPLDFIPLAESTGLIGPLGEWVVTEACRQIAAWRHAGLAVPVVGINVSPYQLPHHHLPDVIARGLSRYDLTPDALCVEVTESALNQGADDMRQLLITLSEMGVRCALDDFGAEYSSLSRIAELPFAMIKIDRGFLRNVPSDPRAIRFLSAIVAVGHSLDLLVTVEGLEHDEQLPLLQRLGVELVQGFLLARPQPADTIRTVLPAGPDRASAI